MSGNHFDLAVVGTGIVGLAAAWELKRRHPDLRMVLVEKETDVAKHQTGNNSGVVHSGIYYKPGSLKARLCVDGVKRLKAFSREHNVRYDDVGKVITAIDAEEVPRLEALMDRGIENGVQGLEMLDDEGIRRHEPFAVGMAGIHSPYTAIVDYPGVSQTLKRLLQDAGAEFRFGTAVTGLENDADGVTLRTAEGEVRAERMLATAGLYADRLARMAGLEVNGRIVPFRGEYYYLRPDKAHMVNGLIYPVPNPALPFLGVHLTRTVGGEVEAGPNAVPAFAREGYKLTDVNVPELADSLSFFGTWRLMARFWHIGLFEIYRSMSRPAFVRSLQRLMPTLRSEDVVRGGAGVRAQAVGPNGRLVDDFWFEEDAVSLHVLNAPSPAATASLAIGDEIAGRMERLLA